MPVQFISKARYFRIGQVAPKNSCFKGTVTPQSIFGGAGSYFDYTERYVGKESDSLMNYTGRYGSTEMPIPLSFSRLSTRYSMVFSLFMPHGIAVLVPKASWFA